MTVLVPVGSQPPRSLAHTSDSNRNLGTFRVRFTALDDRTQHHTHSEFRAGAHVGAREGYDNLRIAIRDLAHATDQGVPAAVVIEREGRYYGYALKARNLDIGLHSPLEAVNFEPNERSEVSDLRTDDRLDRLRAIVDGEYVRRFRDR